MTMSGSWIAAPIVAGVGAVSSPCTSPAASACTPSMEPRISSASTSRPWLAEEAFPLARPERDERRGDVGLSQAHRHARGRGGGSRLGRRLHARAVGRRGLAAEQAQDERGERDDARWVHGGSLLLPATPRWGPPGHVVWPGDDEPSSDREWPCRHHNAGGASRLTNEVA